MRLRRRSYAGQLALALVASAALGLVNNAVASGKSIYSVKCAPCHQAGLLGAPKTGNVDDWKPRMAQGREHLLKRAAEGFKSMPPRGGDPNLSDADLSAALEYMLSQLQADRQATKSEPQKTKPTKSPVVKKTRPAKSTKKVARTKRRRRPSGANSFNRLMKPPSQRNPPPMKDGIHDPRSAGTKALQAPRAAFDGLPPSSSGNRVDWVAALDNGAISPRYDRTNPNASPVIMDLNIIREVKGSMPNVVYPHRAHTQWLDCSNCHPSIFIPQKGANQMSMAGILLGKQCGVCHGKVAFPVSECRRCHSGGKDVKAKQVK